MEPAAAGPVTVRLAETAFASDGMPHAERVIG